MVEPSVVPMGYCKKCRRMPLMKMDGKPKCPKCDIVPEEQTQLRVNVEVNDEDFKLVKNALGYIERVPSDDPRQSATAADIEAAKLVMARDQEQRDRKSPQAETVKMSPSAPVSSHSSNTLVVPMVFLVMLPHDDKIETILTEAQLGMLRDALLKLETPKDMREARSLIKLIDRIEELLGE